MPSPKRAPPARPRRGYRLPRTVTRRSPLALTAALVVAVVVPVALADDSTRPAPPTFLGDSERHSANGAALFELDLPAGTPVVVQLDTDPRFSRPRQVYAGALPAAYVSGLRDGSYHLRARLGDAPARWSAPVHLTVAHHPTSRVWPALGLGLLTFLATLGVLLEGRRRTARQAAAGGGGGA